jgi:hypothetical protein
MRELREVAFRTAAALHAAKGPEPVGLDFLNQSPAGAALLVGAVIDECAEAGIPLARVRVDPYVAVALGGPAPGRRWTHRGTVVEVDGGLFQRAEFHRARAPSPGCPSRRR